MLFFSKKKLKVVETKQTFLYLVRYSSEKQKHAYTNPATFVSFNRTNYES